MARSLAPQPSSAWLGLCLIHSVIIFLLDDHLRTSPGLPFHNSSTPLVDYLLQLAAHFHELSVHPAQLLAPRSLSPESLAGDGAGDSCGEVQFDA